MRALIIDDEKKARSLLYGLLRDNCPEIHEIEEAYDLPSGVRAINTFKPDIVYLDIEMPGNSGLQLLEFLTADQIRFQIIFTTAYSEFAIKAFQLNAIDYLLKPLRDDQVKNATQRAMDHIGKFKLNERLRELKNTFEPTGIRKIGIPVSNGVLFVPFDDIMAFEANRMYTKVYRRGEDELLVSKPLAFFVELLEREPEFYKPHRSFLINLNHIRQYVNQDGGYVIMSDQKTIAISKNRKEELLKMLGQ